jgi:hypothetical protein
MLLISLLHRGWCLQLQAESKLWPTPPVSWVSCECGQNCVRLYRHVARNIGTKIHWSERGYGVHSGPIEILDTKCQQTGTYKEALIATTRERRWSRERRISEGIADTQIGLRIKFLPILKMKMSCSALVPTNSTIKVKVKLSLCLTN